MNILNSTNIITINYHEQSLTEKAQSTDKGLGFGWSEIIENLYLILLSMLPLILFPAFQHVVNEESDVIREIFDNPDVMLLSIPYIMHNVLLVSGKNNLQGKKPLIGWYSLLVITSISMYLLLKLDSKHVPWIQITTIWTFLGVAIISAVIGSVMAYLHKEEK